jgi:hypothetical protein
VLRQIEYLSAHYDWAVIGYGKPHPRWKDVPGVYWIQLIQSGATARTERRIFFVKTLSSWHQLPYGQVARKTMVLNARVEMTKLVMYYRRLFAEADR